MVIKRKIWKYSGKQAFKLSLKVCLRKVSDRMSVRELRELKNKLGYTNEMIAEKTGMDVRVMHGSYAGAMGAATVAASAVGISL